MMGKLFFILLSVGLSSMYGSTIKRIDITKGDENSSWHKYEDSNYSVRDKIVKRYKIEKKGKYYRFSLLPGKIAISPKSAEYFHILPYRVEHIVIQTEQRVLMDMYLSDLQQGASPLIKFDFEPVGDEHLFMVVATDDHNYTTNHFFDIYKKNIAAIQPEDFHDVSKTTHDSAYVKASNATDIASAVESLYGKEAANRVRQRYSHLKKSTRDFFTDWVRLEIVTDKRLSSCEVFTTTSVKKRVLVSRIYYPEIDVPSVYSMAIVYVYPKQDGEILVVAKDVSGKVYMSKLFYGKDLAQPEEAENIKIQFDEES